MRPRTFVKGGPAHVHSRWSIFDHAGHHPVADLRPPPSGLGSGGADSSSSPPGFLGVSWLADVVYYSRQAPGALVGATLALYLAAAFVVGLCTPIRSVTFAPALGHVASVFLWPLSPWGSFGNLTYDIGWVGVAVYTLLQCFVLWLVAFVGWSWQTGSKK